MIDAAAPAVVPAEPADRMPSRRVWEVSYLITFPATVVVVMLAPGEFAHRLVSAGLAASIGVSYAALRGRLDAYSDNYQRRWAFVFNVGAVLAFAGAVRLEFWAGILLTALCPMAYLTQSMAWGHVFVAVLGLLPSVAELARSGDLLGTVTGTLPWSLATIALSVVVATSIARSEVRSAQRADLVHQLQTTRAEVARLAREAGAAEERRRLATDLHDTVTQGLSSIAMLVDAANRTLASDPAVARQHLASAARTVRENLQEARALVGALGPAPADAPTLVDALRRLAVRAGQDGEPHSHVTVSVDLIGAVRPLPTDVEVALLRAAQESLTNVRKHAGATMAWLRLTLGDQTVELEVGDNGRGFDANAAATGYGIAGMRERMRRVGGTLTIHSGTGGGTRVHAAVPA